VNAEQSFHGFQFYNDLIGNDQINPIFSASFQPFVDDRQFYLSQERNIPKSKALTHTFFINRLKQSRPKVSMHLNCRTNNALGQRLAEKPNIPPCLRVSVVGVHGSAIGMRTPVFAANSLASSYPASTCRITPMPGSVVSTRSMRFAIISVPSATVTCPACSE